MVKFSTITTRGGDEGKSSLLGGERRFKSDEVFSLLGDIDELTSVLGLFRAQLMLDANNQSTQSSNPNQQYINHLEDYARRIRIIQDLLQKIGGLLALPIHKAEELGKEYLGDGFTQDFWKKKVEELESWEEEDIKDFDLKGFILPGVTLVGAFGDVARSVTRRLERGLVAYVQRLGLDYLKVPQKFINRLSDYLFVICRWIEKDYL
jgi:cob(I)alamin adenosyltransferase